MSVQPQIRLPASGSIAGRSSTLPSAFSRTRLRAFALAASFGVVATSYLFALASPLRLSSDSVAYLSLANNIALPPGSQRYPPGFPVLLRLAEAVGLGSSWGFVAMNLALLSVAVWAFYRLCREPLGLTATKAAVMCLALLIANQVSELTPIVQSDVPYLAVAMLCLLALSTAERRAGRTRAGFVLLGAALTAVGISIRVEAVALVPPLLVVAVGRDNLRALWCLAKRRRRRATVVAVPSLIALLAITVLVVRASSYAAPIEHNWQPHGDPIAYLSHVGGTLRTRLFSLATLDTQGHCCVYLSHRSPLLPIAGGLALLVVLVVGWLARRRLGAIEVFVLSTAAIILVYGAQPRFWLGALPFMIVYVWFGFERLARFKVARIAIAAYLAAYAIVGGAWLVKSIQISTSGRAFPHLWTSQLHMAPPLADSYFVAFGEASSRAQLNVIPAAVELLRRYEPLARKRAGGTAGAGRSDSNTSVSGGG